MDTVLSIDTEMAVPVTVTTSEPAVPPATRATVMLFPAVPMRTAVQVMPLLTRVALTPAEPDCVTEPIMVTG